MFKNVASQKLMVFAFDSTTNLPKTGDAANITAYVDKDFAGVTVLADTTATEKDATNAKGYYLFDLAQAETNADCLQFSAKSSTANIVVIGVPATVFTTPANWTKAVIDASGLQDANMVKMGPTGAGTAQTARDIGLALPAAAPNAAGGLPISNAGALDLDEMNIDIEAIQTSTAGLTFTGAGKVDASVRDWVGDTIPARNVTGIPIVDTKYVTGTLQTAADVGSLATEINADADELIATIGAAGAGLTAITLAGDFSATMKTSLQTAADAAITANVLVIGMNADVEELIVTLGVAGAGLTGLPAVTLTGDLTATMKTSVQTAADAAITGNALVLEIEADTDTLTTGVNVTQWAGDGAGIAVDANHLPKVDIEALAGNIGGASRLDRSARAIATGTVGSASTTTSIVTSSLSPAAAVTDQFKGRIVIFDKDTTTANLRGQGTDITGSSSAGVLTVSAITTAAVSGDTFCIC